MAISLNKVQLLGNAGKDGETKSTQNGTAVGSLTVATSSSYKDKQGEWQNKTEWHNVTGWALWADKIASVQKGDTVYVEGALETQSWEQDGQKKYKTHVVASYLRVDKAFKQQGQQQNNNNSDIPF